MMQGLSSRLLVIRGNTYDNMEAIQAPKIGNMLFNSGYCMLTLDPHFRKPESNDMQLPVPCVIALLSPQSPGIVGDKIHK
jgi:hypothetical protein